ncbi:hypothetical protein ACP275_09G075700 [Erythranthe tilingii]
MEEQQPLRSPKKMAKALTECQSISVRIDDLGEDLIQNILNRLPAKSFASAACVSRSWNSICNRVLSSPKLSSAVSFNPVLENAVNEVVDKVLLEPIRPHFALVSVGPFFLLEETLQLIEGKLGSMIPIIINVSEGIIGRDVHTDQFVEVQWEVTVEDDTAVLPDEHLQRGIILTVGFLPGLKAHVIPLFQHKGPQGLLVDKFVTDIREAASTASDSASPAGIILFAGRKTNIKPVLQTIEYAFPEDTFIVGDADSQFLYGSNIGENITMSPGTTCAAVALVLTRDMNKPLGIGETKFDVMLSTGVSPIGPTYKANSVKHNKSSTWLTGSRETARQHLDGESILEEIYDQLGDRILYPAFYVGVTKRRKCSVGTEKVRRMQFHEFHEVLGGDEEYLFVNYPGIKTGDPFRFYISDSKAALSSSNDVSDKLRHLKLDCERRNNHASGGFGYSDKVKVFGGIIFSCCGRGDPFFGQPRIDSSTFLNNFPGVTFGGTYCAGEIARGNLGLYEPDDEEHSFIHCNQHVFGAVYLVLSYFPPPRER